MSIDEIKNEDGIKRPEEKYGQGRGGEPGMDDRAAEFVFSVFQEQDAETNPSAAVEQWTKFLSACGTDWILNAAGDAENPEPAVHIVNARMVHAGMGIRRQDIWLDVQTEYTAEHGEFLNRFSGRLNSPFFGFEAEHPTLLFGPIPAGDDPLDEILKKADDRMFSFRWLDGTHFRAFPCVDRSGSLLICDLKNMDRIDIESTNAALIQAGGRAG